MGLERISLLQIGDVHIPDWAASRSSIDLKQSDFSPAIVSSLRTESLSLILEKLRSDARRIPLDAALLMGDLTTKGDTSRLPLATHVISALLNDTRSASKIPIYGVPGNHDVAKKDAVEKGEIGKFIPICQAFESVGWPAPPVSDHVQFLVTNQGNQRLNLYAVNSSIGSWSKALYPDGMKDLIFGPDEAVVGVGDTALLEGTAKAPVYESLEEQVYEQLDTPYFKANDIDALFQKIATSGELAVVVAHHNILPQYLPRISSFGEVLNAGYARDLFLRTNCPIVYLHGHIHTDPIEIIQTPNNRSKIVSISAPCLEDGYNIIHFFAEASGRYFALKLDAVRSKSPTVSRTSQVIPLVSDPQSLLRRGVSKFWDYINNQVPQADRSQMSWAEFREYGAAASVPEADLEGVAIALICAGLAQIENLEVAKEAWRIRMYGVA